MQTYKRVRIPIDSNLAEMNDEEAKVFFEWILKVQEERIKMLAFLIKETAHKPFDLNYSPESLELLGEWFVRMIRIRPRTQEEINSAREELPDWLKNISVKDNELSEETYSLVFDIAFYFSNVFIKNHPQVSWQIYKGKKIDVDHNQPVLKGFGKMNLNPVRIITVMANGIIENKYDGSRLRELYEVWKEYLKEPYEIWK